MSKKPYTRWERFYQQLNIRYHGIIALSLIPFGWAFLETQREFADDPLLGGQAGLVVKVLLVAASAALLGYSRTADRQWLATVGAEDTIADKLKKYLKEKLKLYLLIESVGFLALAGLYLSKDHVFSAIYVAVLFVFSLHRPSFDRVCREVDIHPDEMTRWSEQS